MACEAKNIYYLAFYRKSLLTPDLNKSIARKKAKLKGVQEKDTNGPLDQWFKFKDSG